jgi:hypothetical protein
MEKIEEASEAELAKVLNLAKAKQVKQYFLEKKK